MTINVDGEEITVKICDTDADNATPKLVKGHYLSKKSEIDEIIAKAKELGLQIGPASPSGLVTVQAPPAPAPPPSPRPVPQAGPQQLNPVIAAEISGKDVLPSSVVDSVAQRVQSVAGGEANAESHSAYNPNAGTDKLDPTLLEGKVKMELGQGRGGQPLAVPAVRVDKTGTTTIRVRQDVDDKQLQARFRDLANSTDSDGANKHAYSRGYDIHNCPICRGEGSIVQRGKLDTCPKCHGTGLLNS